MTVPTPVVLTEEQAKDVQVLIATAFAAAPMRANTKRALALNGIVTAAVVVSLISWSRTASAKLEAHDQEIGVLEKGAGEVQQVARENAARSAHDIDRDRRLERIETKLDALDALLRRR